MEQRTEEGGKGGEIKKGRGWERGEIAKGGGIEE